MARCGTLKSPKGRFDTSVIFVRRPGIAPYKRVATELRERIERGELQPGEQLPTLPQLCDEFGVTRNTVSRALGILREEGLVYYEAGWGVFVSDR